MIILIDFENTHASGFQGVEYLDEKDTLVVYYSDENSAISKGLVEDLKEKNVHVRMVKLLKQHSNAFWIQEKKFVLYQRIEVMLRSETFGIA